MTGHNASSAQYGPTPTPTCISCAPTPPLPYTGSDLTTPVEVGSLLLVAGVVSAVIVRRWR